MHPCPTLGTATLVVTSRPVPALPPAEAGRWLGEGWLPYLFFTDVGTGRANLVYRRYDGDLGLIQPDPAGGG